MQNSDFCVLITAAGQSTRTEEAGDKLALPLAGKTVLANAVEAFLAVGIRDVFITVRPGHEDYTRALLGDYPVTFVAGGCSRQDSVYNGLQAIPLAHKYVLIHDGARPFVSAALIERIAAQTRASGAAVPITQVIDSIATVEAGLLGAPLAREQLVALQTPQGFEVELIKTAHALARERLLVATDDSALVVTMGREVALVPGESANVKITTSEDCLRLVKAALVTRIGYGMDTHRLVPGRRLVLAGVEIPSSLGLLGHSDADVIAHAVMDALLGAVGLGDIGQHFPDTVEKYRDANSLVLLGHVVELLAERQAQTQQVDVTLLLEQPKIAPYKEAMRMALAQVLGVPVSAVNIKATTNEGLGFVGRGEGAVCYAVATVTCAS